MPVVNGHECGNKDQAYLDFGNYIAGGSLPLTAYRLQSESGSQKAVSNNQVDIYYPFRSLFTGRKTNELGVEIEDLGEEIVFKAPLPKGLENYAIELPKDYDGKELVEIDPKTYKTKYFIPRVDVIGNGQQEVGSGKLEVGSWVTVSFPKVKGLLSAEINPLVHPEVLEAKNCNQFSGGKVRSLGWEVGNEVGGEKKDVLQLEAEDAINCSAVFYLPDLSHKYSYLISAETKNISGKPLLFWLENLTNRKADMEVYLSNPKSQIPNSKQSQNTKYKIQNTLIQPPMAEDGLGYSLHFDNISIGKQKTVNELGKITVYPIPYRFLTELKIIQSSKPCLWAGRFKVQDDSLKLKVNEVGSEGVKVEANYLNDIYHCSKNSLDLGEGWEGNFQVTHPNPFVYKIEINGKIGKDTLLILSQAYHSGWKAYGLSSEFKAMPVGRQVQSSKLFRILPFVFGENLEHVKVNNWENGWIIQDNRKQETVNNQNGLITDSYDTVILIFWPQYLEYLGFVLLLGCLGILVFKKGGENVGK